MIEGPVDGRPWALFTKTQSETVWGRWSTFKDLEPATSKAGELVLKGYMARVENQVTKEIVYEAHPHPDPNVRRQLREEAAMRELIGDDVTNLGVPCSICGEDHEDGVCLL